MEKKARQSGIELLRILAIMGVIVLHYNNAGIGGAQNYISGTIGNFLMRSLQSICFCAVDLFIMISGYFLCKSQKRSIGKVFFLLFQAVLFSVIAYIIKVIAGVAEFSALGLISSIICIGYFLIFYSIVYIVSPWINLALERMDKSGVRRMTVLLFVIFSVMTSLNDVFFSFGLFGLEWEKMSTVTIGGAHEGYTVVNFFLCYLIGAFIRFNHEDRQSKFKTSGLLAIVFALHLVWGYLDWKSAYTYNNPLIIAEGALLLVLFKNMSFKSNLINKLSKGAFTGYLAHGYFLGYMHIEYHVRSGWHMYLAHVIATAIALYLLCYVVYLIYTLCFSWITKKVSPFIDKLGNLIYGKQS